MIADVARLPRLLRFVAPLAWRTRAKIAQKLMGFSHTEHGSALDMFRAAELTDDPRLKRLFYRHGLDEARHAQHFAQVARQVGGAEASAGHYGRMHAIRQDLYERLGLVRFVAFVWLSESRAKMQFEALSEHFAGQDAEGFGDTLHHLFEEIGRDEHFHSSYSLQLLNEWREQGRGEEVERAIRSVRMDEAWMAWRRAGRRIGDVLVKVLLSTLFMALLPPFALMQRFADRRRRLGWHSAERQALTIEDMRRPY